MKAKPRPRNTVKSEKKKLKQKKGESGGEGGGNELRLRGKVDVILEHELETPSCEHGPCLLFERRRAGAEPERFFACAVCRSRKRCPFFQRAGDDDKPARTAAVAGQHDVKPKDGLLPHVELTKRFKRHLADPERSRLCRTCDDRLLFVDEATADEHRGHELLAGLTRRMLKHPSSVLTAKTDDDKEGVGCLCTCVPFQYWFAARTCECLVEILMKHAKCDAVVCVGCPRLFEALNDAKHPAFLLDIDQRLAQFYSRKKFARYSMFTDHIFENAGLKSLTLFAGHFKKVAVVADPPFGAMLSPLCSSLTKLRERLNKSADDAPLFIVSPYFMEPKIVRGLPAVRMTDLKIDYDNHPAFNSAKSKKGSPARLFTDAPLKQIVLDELKGYRYCAKCERWVYEANRHCNKCAACTGKDGGPYQHCNKCGRCAKVTYRHCAVCDLCHLAKRCPNAGAPHKAAGKKSAGKRRRRLSDADDVKDEPSAPQKKKKRKE